MTDNWIPLQAIQHVFLSFPGIKPEAIKRNVLVVLFYLLVLGVLVSLAVMSNVVPVR